MLYPLDKRWGGETNGRVTATKNPSPVSLPAPAPGSPASRSAAALRAFLSLDAERMGGRVGLASKPGEGGTFWLELPAVPS